MAHSWKRWELFVVCAVAACGSRAGSDGVNPRARPVAIDLSSSFATTGSDPILAAAMEYPPALADDQPEIPVSLTASDGTGLALVRLEARAVIDGPLAFTELHLRFRNPQSRTLEGRFSITLPQDAAISRLAMRIDDGWQEAEVVEKMAARRAYEDFLHRAQDPALMEKEAGNQFRARIFPIPANGEKDIIISYSHELSGAAEYVLPLRGLPEVAELSIAALVATKDRGMERVTVDHKGWVPDRDFRVAPKRAVAGLAHDELVMVRVRPQVNAKAAPIDQMLVLFDTSASRALGFSREVKRLGSLIESLAAANPRMELTVAAYDQSVSPVFDGPASRFGDEHLDAILARRPLGASDLGAALKWARGRVSGRVVIVSDGISTAGRAETNELRDLAKKIGAHRIDAIATGGIRDKTAMAELSRGTSKVDGIVLDGALAHSELARRISSETVSGLNVSIAGARWVWPDRLDGVQPGDEHLVYAFVPDRKGSTVKVKLGDRTHTVALEATVEPLLRRAAVKAELARLEHLLARADAARRADLKRQIISLSTSQRVLSDHTALLVLETEQDYARFNIDRTALVDILTVGKRGVEVFHRNDLVIARRSPDDERLETGKDENTKFKPKLQKKLAELEADKPSLDAFEDADGKPAPKPPAVEPGATEHTITRDVTVEGRVARPDVAGVSSSDDESEQEGDPHEPEPMRASPDAPSPMADSETRGNAGEALAQIKSSPPPYTGEMARVQRDIDAGKLDSAVIRSLKWRTEEPGDVMALIALGESLEMRGNLALAARAYGSIIDLFPSRADLRRFAAARLQRLGASGLGLAEDSLEKAVAQRPDHMTGHRLLAYARARKGDWKGAFAAAEAGLGQDYPAGRFNGGRRILTEDLGIIGAAWVAAEPKLRASVERRLNAAGAEIATRPSLRFVLNWETDANDVDFHILDGAGGHASYRDKQLSSGGILFEDITNGYGPECFRIDDAPTAFPYRFLIHYYSRGPMGYGMGQVEILQHDGKGGVTLDERPFVVMNDSAWVELGQVKGPLK